LKRELNSQQKSYNTFHKTLSTFPLYIGQAKSTNIKKRATDKLMYIIVFKNGIFEVVVGLHMKRYSEIGTA